MKKVSHFLLSLITVFCFITNLNAQHNPEFEEKILELVNELRAQNGAPPVILNTSLNTAARDHSVDMATHNYFSHTGLNGSSFSQRIQNAGYQGASIGENIAAGSSTAEATFNQWVNSTGHFNNMINPSANEMGIGYGFDNQAQYRHYWTQVFGYGNTLSINEFQTEKEEIVMHPNPTKGNLNISLKNTNKQKVFLTIYDVNGKVVYNDQIKNHQDDFKVSFEHLPNGMYYLQINQLSIKKVVKI
ncbi:CAP domain-containing protein [Aquimarina litoralis]|uniref:CAP domain-containing protein n=1 Tax=Aquimarina litoralis TaxID=584605 RepID=UPI001C57A264|nr:CAP domain-containing protein [Aquimarina litoralis]MBW1294938.1 T9SS type A sorting domain-containing protein [Aquimarina litoralis]